MNICSALDLEISGSNSASFVPAPRISTSIFAIAAAVRQAMLAPVRQRRPKPRLLLRRKLEAEGRIPGSFAAIGTGTGVDAIGAGLIFPGLKTIAVTDIESCNTAPNLECVIFARQDDYRRGCSCSSHHVKALPAATDAATFQPNKLFPTPPVPPKRVTSLQSGKFLICLSVGMLAGSMPPTETRSGTRAGGADLALKILAAFANSRSTSSGSGSSNFVLSKSSVIEALRLSVRVE